MVQAMKHKLTHIFKYAVLFYLKRIGKLRRNCQCTHDITGASSTAQGRY